MPSFLQTREKRDVYLEDFTAPLSQSMGAVWDTMGIGEGLWHWDTLRRMQQIDPHKLTEDEIQDRVGDLPLEVEPGVSASKLSLMIETKRNELRRQRILSRAKEGVTAGTMHFAAGIASSLADPGDLLVSFVPYFGQAKHIARLEKATAALERGAIRARAGVTGGVTGAIVAEPLIYGLARGRQEDYTLEDSFLNIVFGGVMGGGLHTLGGAVADRLSYRPRSDSTARVVDNLKPETRAAALRTAANQWGTGRQIDVGPILETDPAYSYLSRSTLKAPPAGVGGSRTGSRLNLDDVHAELRRDIKAREQSVFQELEARVLPRGELKKLRAEQRQLEYEIKRSEAEVAKRSPQDVLHKAHSKGLREYRPRLKEIAATLDEQEALRARMGRERQQIDRAREVLDKPDSDIKSWPPFLRKSLDQKLEDFNRTQGARLLRESVSLRQKQDQNQTFSLGLSREASEATRIEVSQKTAQGDEGLLDEMLQDVQARVADLEDTVPMGTERSRIDSTYSELESEVAELEKAMKAWSLCRQING